MSSLGEWSQASKPRSAALIIAPPSSSPRWWVNAGHIEPRTCRWKTCLTSAPRVTVNRMWRSPSKSRVRPSPNADLSFLARCFDREPDGQCRKFEVAARERHHHRVALAVGHAARAGVLGDLCCLSTYVGRSIAAQRPTGFHQWTLPTTGSAARGWCLQDAHAGAVSRPQVSKPSSPRARTYRPARATGGRAEDVPARLNARGPSPATIDGPRQPRQADTDRVGGDMGVTP